MRAVIEINSNYLREVREVRPPRKSVIAEVVLLSLRQLMSDNNIYVLCIHLRDSFSPYFKYPEL
jgi:hypothetical protein